VASLDLGDNETGERPEPAGRAGRAPRETRRIARRGEKQQGALTRAISRPPKGFERVRRPSDLLFAIFAFAVVALVLVLVRALPIGSTEIAHDVSSWLGHIPKWLAVGSTSIATLGSVAFATVALSVLFRREER
jgi:hypothetical protein